MNTENEQKVIQHLAVLRNQPARNAEQAARGRAAFIEQAQTLANQPRQPVSPMTKERPIGWLNAIWTYFIPSTKKFAPITTVATLCIIFTLLLGGLGMTVAAAQNSLPDQALYPLKTWSEDVRTRFTAGEQARINLALELTDRRAAEIQAMLAAGQPLPDSLAARYQAQAQTAIALAASQPDSLSAASLAQVQSRLQGQEQAFAGLTVAQADQASLQHTRDMLRDMLKLCDTGLHDPAVLRQQLRDQDQLNAQDPAGQQRQLTNTLPVGSGGGNPWTTGTPTPGSGYGSSGAAGSGGNDGSGAGGNPWTTGTPTPGSGYRAPSATTGSGSGGNLWTTGTPTPGSNDGSPSGSGGNDAGPGTGQPGGGGNQPAMTDTPAPGSGSGSGGPGGGAGGPGGKP